MKSERTRFWILWTAVGLVMLVFLGVMMHYQLVRGEEFAGRISGAGKVSQLLTAARGEIVDCNGVPFTANSSHLNIRIDCNYIRPDDLNETVLGAVRMAERFGCPWRDILPVSKEPPFSYEGDEKDVRRLKKVLNISENAPVEDAIYWLEDRYQLKPCPDEAVFGTLRRREEFRKLEEKEFLERLRDAVQAPGAGEDELLPLLRRRYNLRNYTETERRILAGIRYTMEEEEFGLTNPYTFAEDVAPEWAACAEESSRRSPWMTAEMSARREYPEGNTACHVLGMTGRLDPAEYDSLRKDGKIFSKENPAGYRMTDVIGKSGLERAYEDELRGRNGQRVLTVDGDGNVLRAEVTEPGEPGHTLMLTINQDVQKAAREALVRRIRELNGEAPGRGREADAGSVVAIDCRTGGIIAMVSYPDFPLSSYYDDYGSLVRQSPSPLINRASQGLYTVGSTYKPAVAVAGLAEGFISPGTTVNCTGVYTYFKDYQPRCEGVHGPVNVIRSLQVSCNTFYYDLGRRMGIGRINEYSGKLGLGRRTGIEIPEAEGQLSSPETRAAVGEKWLNSYDMQSAIGQLDNQFTVLQLANYTATLANRGHRMRAHLVDKIWDYNMRKVLWEARPEEADRIEAEDSVWDTVREGMIRSTCRGGTSGATWGWSRGGTWLERYGVRMEVAGKTGSPQTANDLANSAFIGYAPADDPQIAVAVLIEKGFEGDRAAPVAKAVMESYFFGPTGTMRDRIRTAPSPEPGSGEMTDAG